LRVATNRRCASFRDERGADFLFALLFDFAPVRAMKASFFSVRPDIHAGFLPSGKTNSADRLSFANS